MRNPRVAPSLGDAARTSPVELVSLRIETSSSAANWSPGKNQASEILPSTTCTTCTVRSEYWVSPSRAFRNVNATACVSSR
jgi:hypothetical protein